MPHTKPTPALRLHTQLLPRRITELRHHIENLAQDEQSYREQLAQVHGNNGDAVSRRATLKGHIRNVQAEIADLSREYERVKRDQLDSEAAIHKRNEAVRGIESAAHGAFELARDFLPKLEAALDDLAELCAGHAQKRKALGAQLICNLQVLTTDHNAIENALTPIYQHVRGNDPAIIHRLNKLLMRVQRAYVDGDANAPPAVSAGYVEPTFEWCLEQARRAFEVHCKAHSDAAREPIYPDPASPVVE